MAKRVGIKRATISNFETRPDKATLSTMFKIIQALDLTVKVETRSESKRML
ncbi:helix-turn-helix domain-containing protein [Vibrio sp. 10N.286.46.A8]|uniref:helix-turn-helix domain-containing protein n=1 Tax=Vibrio sp. 10N.286.46.A8 TaxID=3229697 RepID=UPI0035570E55